MSSTLWKQRILTKGFLRVSSCLLLCCEEASHDMLHLGIFIFWKLSIGFCSKCFKRNGHHDILCHGIFIFWIPYYWQLMASSGNPRMIKLVATSNQWFDGMIKMHMGMLSSQKAEWHCSWVWMDCQGRLTFFCVYAWIVSADFNYYLAKESFVLIWR